MNIKKQSHWGVCVKIGVLKIFAKLRRKHLCWSLIVIKFQTGGLWFLRNFLITPFLQDTSERLKMRKVLKILRKKGTRMFHYKMAIENPFFDYTPFFKSNDFFQLSLSVALLNFFMNWASNCCLGLLNTKNHHYTETHFRFSISVSISMLRYVYFVSLWAFFFNFQAHFPCH